MGPTPKVPVPRHRWTDRWRQKEPAPYPAYSEDYAPCKNSTNEVEQLRMRKDAPPLHPTPISRLGAFTDWYCYSPDLKLFSKFPFHTLQK